MKTKQGFELFISFTTWVIVVGPRIIVMDLIYHLFVLK